MNHSEIVIMFTNLAIVWGPHLVVTTGVKPNNAFKYAGTISAPAHVEGDNPNHHHFYRCYKPFPNGGLNIVLRILQPTITSSNKLFLVKQRYIP